MEARALAEIVTRFSRQRLLVVGDLVADEYIMGRPARISREAPVLILEQTETRTLPGEAANVAVNGGALSARVAVCGVIGDDLTGQRLIGALERLGIDHGGVVIGRDRLTTSKTRVVAGGSQEMQQQIVRVDRLESRPIEDSIKNQLIDFLRGRLPETDALIISDYEAGVIDSEVLDACLPLARERGIVITVDSHADLFRFRGATAATPNQPEAEGSTQTSIRTESDLLRVGRLLLDGMDARGILITRGSEGMALFERNRPAVLLPVSNYSEVRDVTGAGDTVATVFTLALASGASMRESACLANLAAGLVVRKWGVATTTPAELEALLAQTQVIEQGREIMLATNLNRGDAPEAGEAAL